MKQNDQFYVPANISFVKHIRFVDLNGMWPLLKGVFPAKTLQIIFLFFFFVR